MSVIIAIALCWLPSIGFCETYYVSLDGLDSRTGTADWTNALRTIGNAITKATSAGDVVLVSNGTYVLTETARLVIDTHVTIMSLNGPEQTIIDGNYPTRNRGSVTMGNPQALLSGFTISNSSAAGGSIAVDYGGGVRVNSGIVSNCIIRNCSSRRGGGGAAVYGTNSFLLETRLFDNYAEDHQSWGGGGGVYASDGNVFKCIISNCVSPRGGGMFLQGVNTIQACTINSNSASTAGGLLNNTGASEIKECTISSNNAILNAGGLYLNANHNALVSNCVIEGNSVNGSGGGLYAAGGNRVFDSTIQFNTAGDKGGGARSSAVIWERCLIQNNLAENEGGGLYAAGGDFTSCLIASNDSHVDGGGVYIYRAETAMRNCTIVANTASNTAGGVYIGRGSTGTYTNLMVNTIVYFNTAASSSNWYGAYYPDYVSFTNCCLAPVPAANYASGSGNTASNPAMVNVDEGNYHLTKESPCVNTGLLESWMINAVDLDGRAFPDRFSGLPDMGCYEFVWPGSMIKLY